MNKYTLADLHRDMIGVVQRAPDIGIVWALLKKRARVATVESGVAQVADDGSITVDPLGFGSRPESERQFIAAHELMHWLLKHSTRVQELSDAKGIRLTELGKGGRPQWNQKADPEAMKTWGQATDIVINETLAKLKLAIPNDALTLVNSGNGYRGPMSAEGVWRHLYRAAQAGSSSGSSGGDMNNPGRGCAPDGSAPSNRGAGDKQTNAAAKSAVDAAVASLVESDLQSAVEATLAERGESGTSGQRPGVGSSPLLEVLRAERVRLIDFSDVLKRGFNMARSGGKRVGSPNYTVPGRRTRTQAHVPGQARVIHPSRNPTTPSLCIIIDVSGSMHDAVPRIVSHAVKLSKQLGQPCYLITHAERVTWEGVLKSGDEQTIIKACGYSGGTSFDDAYLAAKKARPSGFDVLVHFTDSEVYTWPEAPARELVVGLCLRRDFYRKPSRSRFTTIVVDERP